MHIGKNYFPIGFRPREMSGRYHGRVAITGNHDTVGRNEIIENGFIIIGIRNAFHGIDYVPIKARKETKAVFAG